MRKLKIIEHISLDGIVQAPGGPNEDGDYPYGGWTVPYRHPATGAVVVAEHSKPFDLLLGRRTYDIFAGFWPKAPSSPLADGLNAATKYVATHQPGTLAWGPCEAFGPDLVEGVRRIKQKPGPDLILWGSSTLTPTLLEHGLADEVMLLVYPVLLGKGKRFFSESIPARKLTLTGSQAVPSGVLINTYTAAGGIAELRVASNDPARSPQPGAAAPKFATSPGAEASRPKPRCVRQKDHAPSCCVRQKHHAPSCVVLRQGITPQAVVSGKSIMPQAALCYAKGSLPSCCVILRTRTPGAPQTRQRFLG
jgi:dihydrofolate reductase